MSLSSVVHDQRRAQRGGALRPDDRAPAKGLSAAALRSKVVVISRAPARRWSGTNRAYQSRSRQARRHNGPYSFACGMHHGARRARRPSRLPARLPSCRTPSGSRFAASDAVHAATPVEAEAGGQSNGGWPTRPTPERPAAVVEARCPHRLVRLVHGTHVSDRLRCPARSCEFESGRRVRRHPLQRRGRRRPDRRAPAVPDAVGRARGGRRDLGRPAAPGGPDLAPDRRAEEQVLTNVDRRSAHKMAPGLALNSSELPATVPPAGQDLHRRQPRRAASASTPSTVGARTEQPSPERFGVVFVAPEPHAAALLDVPEDGDPYYAQGSLVRTLGRPAWSAPTTSSTWRTSRSCTPARSARPRRPTSCPGYALPRAVGCRSVQEQWFDNPETPAVAAGDPAGAAAAAGHVRLSLAPFQMLLRLEELDAGSVKTSCSCPTGDARSTRLYTKLLLHGIGGVAGPAAGRGDPEVAFEDAVLAEDLTCSAR